MYHSTYYTPYASLLAQVGPLLHDSSSSNLSR